jgi:hypothetical protein
MIWNAATPAPKNHETRVVDHFCWLPTRLGNKVYWLERYWTHEVYIDCGDGAYWFVIGVHTSYPHRLHLQNAVQSFFNRKLVEQKVEEP